MTRVKIIVAPAGIPAKYDIIYPTAVPVNPDRIEKSIILEYVRVKSNAIFGGIVRSDRTRITPAILMFRTMVRATSDVVIYLNMFT